MHRQSFDGLSFFVAAALLMAPPVLAATPCSSDQFPVDGHQVTVQLCTVGDPPAHGAAMPVQATISGNHQAITQIVDLHLLGTTGTAHAIDDVSLEPLGIHRLVHLTIGYNQGRAHLEHALLVPGAIPLK